MRGLAVLIMIQCHAFNSFTRPDLRQGAIYVLTQFVGGMAAPLFLFMAGMTSAFQMASADKRNASRFHRWLAALRRAGYILFVAYLFRFSNWVFSFSRASFQELTKVDILNCMGLALVMFSLVAALDLQERVRVALAAALLVAVAAPLVAGLDWTAVPLAIRDYVVPSPNRGRFPFFPCAAYVGFGIVTGSAVRHAAGRMDRLMQWAVLVGLGLLFCAHYFGSLPYSVYPQSDFWRNSPALILIRVGIALVMLAAAYVWTEYVGWGGWSWIQALGKTSLLVYWVHVMLVYGNISQPLQRNLTIPQTALITLTVMILMVGLAQGRLWWRRGRMSAKSQLLSPAPSNTTSGRPAPAVPAFLAESPADVQRTRS